MNLIDVAREAKIGQASVYRHFKADLVLGVSTWAWEQYRKEMFSATLHLMMAAATRYAVGLICDAGVDPEKELELLKDMLMQRFTVSGGRE